jgi:hypothetical protein
MIEVIVERWIAADGKTDYLWSLWHVGKRIQMGGSHDSADLAEAEARTFCQRNLGRPPDRITRL